MGLFGGSKHKAPKRKSIEDMQKNDYIYCFEGISMEDLHDASGKISSIYTEDDYKKAEILPDDNSASNSIFVLDADYYIKRGPKLGLELWHPDDNAYYVIKQTLTRYTAWYVLASSEDAIDEVFQNADKFQ